MCVANLQLSWQPSSDVLHVGFCHSPHLINACDLILQFMKTWFFPSLFDSMFQLQSSTNCNNDYVEIREQNSTGPLIGRFCGNSLPSNYTSLFGHVLWVKFVSDASVSGAGFRATFSLCEYSFKSQPNIPFKCICIWVWQQQVPLQRWIPDFRKFDSIVIDAYTAHLLKKWKEIAILLSKDYNNNGRHSRTHCILPTCFIQAWLPNSGFHIDKLCKLFEFFSKSNLNHFDIGHKIEIMPDLII